MLRLRIALQEAGISQAVFASTMGRCPKHLSKILCGRTLYRPKFREAVRRFLDSDSETAAPLRTWMAQTGAQFEDLFDEIDGEIRQHSDRHSRTNDNITKALNETPMAPGNPDQLEPHPNDRSDKMITLPVLKHFKLSRNPFMNEIREPNDIFMSQDHLYIKSMIVETAMASGLCAVHGEVGSGKSTMRKAVYKELDSLGCRVIFPAILDKTRVTASSLLDAIIMDLSDQGPKRSMEAKTRQAYDLLKARKDGGHRQVLIIEEAHLLNVWALKATKQIWEFEDAYSRLCGVVMIGQTELGAKMNESMYPQLREVIKRTVCAEIRGMEASDVEKYLRHKIARTNGRSGNPPEIFHEKAFNAMAMRLSDTSKQGRPISRAYPLSVNNLAARSMAFAAEIGEAMVTDEVVNSL